MPYRMLSLFMLPLLVSCEIRGPVYQVDAIEANAEQLHLVLAKSWERSFASYQETERSEFYVSGLEMREPVLSRARPLFSAGRAEGVRFVKVAGTDLYLAIVGKAQRAEVLLLESSQPMSKSSAKPIQEFDTATSAFATSRSGRYFLLITENELLIKDVVSNTVVERSQESPLLNVRSEFAARFGRASGPGSWWITDDLRYVVMKPPRFIDGSATPESVPSDLFGLNLDLAVHGLVYDRQTGRFHICHQFLRFDDDPGRSPLADAETVKGELLLLYGANVLLDTIPIGVTDLATTVKHHVRLPAGHAFLVRDFVWRPDAMKLHLVLSKQESGPATGAVEEKAKQVRTRIVVRTNVQVDTWDYGRGTSTAIPIPAEQLEEAIEQP